jgi:predicted MFS family arabinose efflux permease
MLRQDAGMANSESESDARISWRQVKYVLIDWRVYLYFVISMGNLGVIKCFTLFLPCLLNQISHSTPLTHLITVPPYIAACFCCVLGGYSSSRRNEHGLHIAFFLFVALLGFISMLIVADRNKVAIYISSCIVCCGLYTAFPIALSWLTKNIGGHTKRALAVCCFIAMGQLGGSTAFKVSVLHLLSFKYKNCGRNNFF